PALLTEGAKRVARVVPEWVGGIAAGLPLLVASLILFLFSGYYFSCEWDRARALFFRLCPEKKRAGVIKRKSAFLKALKKILRAYGLLFVITFCELLAGFWILRVPGSVGKALVTAVVDALPVFGCGTVLIPWGIVLLLRKQTVQGIGMLVLYGAMWVIRQFLEPRVVGRSVGLHPVVSLILVIGGLALFGIWGILLVPVVSAFVAETAADPPATEACRAGAGSRAPRGGKKADGKTA
ncbi:MAG: AI-2E family transporter, partial [Clostridia bacterium]|nr:AI-2E family transporter [Clostridia bacterium]